MTIIYSAIMSIYMIRPNEPSLHDFYIGSCEDFITRMAKHKYNCNNENSRHYNVKVYQHMRANGGWDAWKMIKIASVWKKATKPLFQIEQDYIDTYKPSLNCKRAYQTKQQRKESHNEHNRKYSEENKDIISEKKKEHYQKNKDIIIERVKEYYQNNKDIINEKKKEHYQKNKDRIYEYRKEKFSCECGGKYTRTHKARHVKSIKHQKYVENKE